MPDGGQPEHGDLTPMAMNCAAQHEMFLGWQAEAFELIKVAIAAAFGAHL